MDVDMTLDIGDIMAFQDAVHNSSEALSKKTTMNRIVTAGARKGREQFGDLIDLTAADNEEAFHHVYEWDATGNKHARLFRMRVSKAAEGRITNMVDFLPSTRNVPPRQKVGDTIDVFISLSSGNTYWKEIEVFPDSNRHVFRDKAWVMENGITVDIQPRKAKMLFWVDPVTEVGYMNTGMQLDYSDKPTYNSFMKLWNLFWETMAEERILVPMMEHIEPAVQDAVEDAVRSEAASSGTKTKAAKKGTHMVDGGEPIRGGGKPKKDKGLEKLVEQAVARALTTYG